MGFQGVIIAAASLFSSVVSGYMAVYFLGPLVGQWVSDLGQHLMVGGAFASWASAVNPTSLFIQEDPNSWLGLANLVCAVLLLGLFMRTLKALAD